MGMIQHQVFCFTGFPNEIEDLHHETVLRLAEIDWAGLVSPVSYGMNGYCSFTVAPCGSQLGWPEHAEFITCVLGIIYDMSDDINFVITEFGGDLDHNSARILTLNDLQFYTNESGE